MPVKTFITVTKRIYDFAVNQGHKNATINTEVYKCKFIFSFTLMFYQVIRFSVVTFSIIYSEGCEHDRLTLYDGQSMDPTTHSRVYCGSVGPDQFITTTNSAVLYLTASSSSEESLRSKIFVLYHLACNVDLHYHCYYVRVCCVCTLSIRIHFPVTVHNLNSITSMCIIEAR